ncbi:MAG: HAMP domain-containing protein, partial [Thermoleophilaceae bacterium]|nr:HAMP domain-containing protein [Thermoleophilaceae bacterium]
MLTGKLALLFFAITAAAFSVIYFYGVAQLESNLENQKQRDLRRVAGASSQTLEDVMGREIPSVQLDKLVRSVADSGDARVTLLGVQRSGPTGPPQGLQFFAISDSTAERRVDINPGLAARAVRTGRITAATTGVPGAEVSQVAQPLYFRGRADWVALYSRSLDDVAESVALIRRQILAATAVALLVALLGGYLVARALARRVRRIEAGAKQVAAGHYIDPLPVTSEDELGQLSRTFNEMQEQLARVDRARKDFIATASHELRTPIFSLAGFVELLQDEELDEPTRDEFLQTMHEQVERLQKLAVDLLDLSRLDTGSV